MTNTALWNRNFALLVIANTMLYMAVYMLFPLLHHWSMESWGCTELTASAVTAVFAVALFFPGILNAYLVDTFPRITAFDQTANHFKVRTVHISIVIIKLDINHFCFLTQQVLQ